MVWNYQNADYNLRKTFIVSFIIIFGTLSFPIVPKYMSEFLFCNSGFPDDVVFAQNSQAETTRTVKVTQRGQHGFDTAAYIQADPPAGNTQPGRSLHLRLPCQK